MDAEARWGQRFTARRVLSGMSNTYVSGMYVGYFLATGVDVGESLAIPAVVV